MDQIIFTGRLGRDPEQSTTSGGTNVTRMNVAVSHYAKGERTTEWRQVSAFNKTGEFCLNHMRKGDFIVVVGTPKVRCYENKKIEEWVATMDVNASMVEFAGNKGDSGEAKTDGAPDGYTPVDDSDVPF